MGPDQSEPFELKLAVPPPERPHWTFTCIPLSWLMVEPVSKMIQSQSVGASGNGTPGNACVGGASAMMAAAPIAVRAVPHDVDDFMCVLRG
ncbi:hypothetical protein H7K45_20975 [Mycobacterium yunnanensis]|uniref:Uncharacterized protein n=1 Tax=Mycobacterium yunnanensis TaxID=368477 RepID=A0A9X2Z621_9MYCO|nr:hypothetical protein [Mycobacterium yunnanensis]MCV7423030.1 hypothetical protein [Mycobacterium yunnanensis]